MLKPTTRSSPVVPRKKHAYVSNGFQKTVWKNFKTQISIGQKTLIV